MTELRKGQRWFITSKNVCSGDRLFQAWIEIVDGRIQSVLRKNPEGFSGRIDDYGDLIVLPGLVDSHVHVNEPGRTEWEGFDTATHAAAAGGTTTLVDMPLNCIPVTTSIEAFSTKLKAIQGRLGVDVGFWGGAISGNLAQLPKLLDSGVLGVKSFLIDSGIPEFPPMSLEEIGLAMPLLAERKMPYLFHAELDRGEAVGRPQGPDYQSFLASRPKAWENHAIEAVIELARLHGGHIHIVHLSSAEALKIIFDARERLGTNLTVETCPHYLLLNDRQVGEFSPAEEQTLFKCCPPIRDEENRQALWKALLDGTIDMVVSDHSPCSPSLKGFGKNNFADAWGGISSLQYTLSLLWSEGQKHGVSFPQLASWLSQKPAALAGLSRKKGRIYPGFDADFAIFDPAMRWKITHEGTFHRHKFSPYQGRELQGKVRKTYLRGRVIFDDGMFFGDPTGEFLLRGKV